MEGAVIFGMSHAFYGGATMKGGVTEQSNFNDYRLIRCAEAHPRRAGEEREAACGVGEPAVPPIAPAIANAIFALTGQRIRELPLVRAGIV